MDGKTYLKTFDSLVNQRKTLETYYKEAYQYTMPHRGQYFLSNNNDGYTNASNAQKDISKIFDSTAADAVSLLSASIMSGLTPSASQWFQFKINGVSLDNLPYDVKVWLEQASKRLFNLIHNSSNFNAVALEAMQDMAIAGMFGLYVTKEENQDFIFELWSLDSMYVIENIKTKVIDTIYRNCAYTAKEAVEQFGIDNIPDGIAAAYKNNKFNPKTYDFVHIIQPREGKHGPTAKQMPIASIYVCKRSGMIVKESGYLEMPVVVPRWNKIPRTPYALGPTNAALPDIKTLNKVVEMMLQNADMAIAGTYVAKNDGYLNPNTIKIGARKIIFSQDVNNIKPLSTGGDFRIAFEEITRLQKQIKSVMMADELEPIQKDYASATEVQTRAQIVRQILAPIFARLQSEFLEPLLNRCFYLALRDGSLGNVPESLVGAEIIPEYISPMARAQKLEEVASMDRFEQSIATTAQLNPGVLDIYDFDKAASKKASLLGVPSDVIRSNAQLKQIRQQQAEQQAAAQQAAMQQQVATDPAMLKVGLEAAGGAEGLQKMIGG